MSNHVLTIASLLSHYDKSIEPILKKKLSKVIFNRFFEQHIAEFTRGLASCLLKVIIRLVSDASLSLHLGHISCTHTLALTHTRTIFVICPAIAYTLIELPTSTEWRGDKGCGFDAVNRRGESKLCLDNPINHISFLQTFSTPCRRWMPFFSVPVRTPILRLGRLCLSHFRHSPPKNVFIGFLWEWVFEWCREAHEL